MEPVHQPDLEPQKETPIYQGGGTTPFALDTAGEKDMAGFEDKRESTRKQRLLKEGISQRNDDEQKKSSIINQTTEVSTAKLKDPQPSGPEVGLENKTTAPDTGASAAVFSPEDYQAAAPTAVEPVIDTSPSQSSQAMDQLLNAPISQIAGGMNSLGTTVQKAFNADRKAIAKNTKVKANLESDAVEPPPPPPDVAKPNTPNLDAWVQPENKVQRKDIPKVDTSGDANPQKVDQQSRGEDQKARARQEQAAGEIASLPGQEQIQGVDLEVGDQLDIPDASTAPQARMTPEMENYLKLPLGSFRDRVDQAARPNWESDMASARKTIMESIEKRDQEQAKAVAETQQEAARLEGEARQKQEQEVARSRGAIQAEKERGMAESQAQLEEYRTKAGTERDKHLTQIEHRIQADEQMAEQKMNEADQQIEQEKNKAEKEKEEEKKKAEEKKKKRSFWQKIGDFFSSIFKALKKVLKKIVDGLTKLVKSILEAAQKLVNNIIDLARKFIVSAIQAFAKVLRAFLEVALAAFPGIRDEVLGMIDQIVNTTIGAINRIANFLQESINALVSKINMLVDFISNFYESLIEGGFAMLQAILTGNFSELPKIAFMTACNALGLPGEEFWNILMKAKNEIFNIIKNPVGFLKNLIAAAKGGFNNFMKNFVAHLQRGLMGWLFGQMDQTGIVLPRRFDLPSMFNFIRKLLGFTLAYVEDRIVMHIGEENIEKARQVIAFFRTLFEQGPGVIWETFKARLGNIKQMIMAKVQEFIVVQIVQKAVMKLISMLVPGGGFLQAIWGAYQTLMFFLDNIRKIAALVNGIMDSLGRITRGAIAEASILIENVMVNSLPLIFKFLAKLIGISGIGARIAKIIEKLRTPVNKAIDLTVGKAVSGVKSGYGKMKSGARKGWNKVKTSGKKGFRAARKGGLKAGFQSVKSDAQEAKESAKEQYRLKKEQAREKLQQTKDQAREKFSAAKEGAQAQWADAKTGFKGGRRKLSAKAKGKMREKWQNAKDGMKERIASARNALFRNEAEEEAQTDIKKTPPTSDPTEKETRKQFIKVPTPHQGLRVSGEAKDPETKADWADALTDLNLLLEQTELQPPTDKAFRRALFNLRVEHDFSYLSGAIDEGKWRVRWQFNPSGRGEGKLPLPKLEDEAAMEAVGADDDSGEDAIDPSLLEELHEKDLKAWSKAFPRFGDSEFRKDIEGEIITLLKEVRPARIQSQIYRLKAKLAAKLKKTNSEKKKAAIRGLLAAIDRHEKVPIHKKQFLEQRVQSLIKQGKIFSEPDAKGNKRLETLRYRLLMNTLENLGTPLSEMSDEYIISQASRGIEDGQWVGRLLCDDSCRLMGGTLATYESEAHGSTIKYNHVIVNQSEKSYEDFTWKQFFSPTDSKGKPPIFKGGPQQFIDLGLDWEDTKQYLILIGYGGFLKQKGLLSEGGDANSNEPVPGTNTTSSSSAPSDDLQSTSHRSKVAKVKTTTTDNSNMDPPSHVQATADSGSSALGNRLAGIALHPALSIDSPDIEESTDVEALQRALLDLNKFAERMESRPFTGDAFYEELKRIRENNPGLKLDGHISEAGWSIKWAFNPGGIGGDESSADFARRSIKEGRAAAYIINSILPFSEVDWIPEVVAAMLRGLGERDYTRVAIVLGVNGHQDHQARLTEALQRAQVLAGQQTERFRDLNIQIVGATFTGEFPYGTMRNLVLHSAPTKQLTQQFTDRDLHPYIAFQDFDTGSRKAKNEEGEHVFYAVDRLLRGEPDAVMRDSPFPPETVPIRPLMIAGGYRVGNPGKLVEDTRKRMEKDPISGIDPSNFNFAQALQGFPETIAQDMAARDRTAMGLPTLPYAPEPNLFVDATAALKPSPGRNSLNFSTGGAEYTGMAKSVNQYAAAEMESLAARQLPSSSSSDDEETYSRLVADSQNNRHPSREQIVLTRFQDLAIETDLSRLAYAAINGHPAQTHNLSDQVTRVFAKKEDKRGTKLAASRDQLAQQLQASSPEKQANDPRFQDPGKMLRKGGVGKKLSPAVSVPFTGPLAGRSFGMDAGQKKPFLGQLALNEARRLPPPPPPYTPPPTSETEGASPSAKKSKGENYDKRKQ